MSTIRGMSSVKPRLLDLFCGAGGAAMGYHRAGFEVVGVDIKPQPHYPFEFHQADAMDILRGAAEVDADPLDGALPPWALFRFDAIHASPPCQAYSSATDLAARHLHPDLYVQVRTYLHSIGIPWVIENVEGAPQMSGVVLCGSMFGLRIRRHRVFESSVLMLTPGCNHGSQGQVLSVTGNGYGGKHAGHNATKPSGIAEAREVMGIEWMSIKELSQAIPPAYTEWIGRQLLASIERAA